MKCTKPSSSPSCPQSPGCPKYYPYQTEVVKAVAPAPATDTTTVLTDQVRVLTENMSVLMAAFQHVPRKDKDKDKHGEGWCDKCRYLFFFLILTR